MPAPDHPLPCMHHVMQHVECCRKMQFEGVAVGCCGTNIATVTDAHGHMLQTHSVPDCE